MRLEAMGFMARWCFIVPNRFTHKWYLLNYS